MFWEEYKDINTLRSMPSPHDLEEHVGDNVVDSLVEKLRNALFENAEEAWEPYLEQAPVEPQGLASLAFIAATFDESDDDND